MGNRDSACPDANTFVTLLYPSEKEKENFSLALNREREKKEKKNP